MIPIGKYLSITAALALAGCSTEDTTSTQGARADTGSGGTSDTEPFIPPAEPGPGGFWVTVSGEDLALLGYDFGASSRADGDPPAFVDGWALRFEHVIVTVGELRIQQNPDRDAADPFDLGPLVAAAAGPWAVDVSIGGGVTGKSGSPDERTVAIAAFAEQDSGQPFDGAERYAFSYDLVPAAADARRVNLDAEGAALYTQAIAQGWSMILAGTASYQGPAPEPGSVFERLPLEVEFTLGLANPSSYVNCRNTDLLAAGGEFPRGIQANAGGTTIVQLTLHTDHAFWDRLNVEGTPLHFDPIAARASSDGPPATPGQVDIDDLANADVSALTTRDGAPLPWRSVVPDYTAPPGQMSYDANGTAFSAPNSLAAYLAYSAASGGHLNADGECEVRNNFVP
jgi:hypothetical protein